MPAKTERVRMIYFEDFQEGVQPVSPEIVVDGKEMLEYNHKYDPWPFHVDEKAAKASPFGGLIASGGYTISIDKQKRDLIIYFLWNKGITTNEKIGQLFSMSYSAISHCEPISKRPSLPNFCVSLKFWHFSEASALSSKYYMYSCG